MEKFETDEEFKQYAIKLVEKDIKEGKYPCIISSVSKVHEGGCEWCSNTTRRIFIGVSKKPKAADFTKGHCNSGQYSIHEDPSFRPQSDWFVCGKCKDS
jgi:hypothetical protein